MVSSSTRPLSYRFFFFLVQFIIIVIYCQGQDPDTEANATQVPTASCDLECFNGGECDVAAENACLCPPGTSGNQCETLEETTTTITETPTCTPGNEASCPSVASESAPETEAPSSAVPAVCDPECQNGGQCQLGVCVCNPGTSGDMCEVVETSTTQAPSAVSCDTLICQNGGTCTTTGPNGVECSCPTGTSGDFCEEIVAEVACGLDKCRHGSSCIHTSDGAMFCDCGTINDPGKHYAGQYCQYEATTYCEEAEEYFCVNGGKCHDEGNGAFSCECPEAWTGPSCEFESQDRDHAVNNCTLTCRNGGVCRKGAKDPSPIDGFSEGADETQSENIEHCVCPPGFTGAKCEHAYEECGNGEHMCLHGTKCVPPKDDQHPNWTCECDDDNVGTFCQHHRSSECTSADTGNTVYRGLTSLITCVNDGVCMTYEENGKRYPACKCPELYTGPHCELLKSDAQRTALKLQNNKESAASIFVLFTLGVLLVVAVLFVYTRTRGQSSRDKTAMVRAAHIEDAASKSPNMEEVDFEGVMEDVELL